MDTKFSPEAEKYRLKVRDFVRSSLPADWKGVGALRGEELAEFMVEWRKLLFENGLLAPSWPKEYGGGGLTAEERVVLTEEFAYAGVPTGTPNDEMSIDQIGNTIVEHGTEEQKQTFLPGILSGEYVFCQGYSEPDAGSDLANIRTRAVQAGDRWIINGQKIWTSEGMHANWIFALVRTEEASTRHRGLTMILLPLDQPGVEVRPITMITGASEFCEIFFDNAVAERKHIVGEVGDGWSIAMNLLGYERGETSVTLPLRFGAELVRIVELARMQGVLDSLAIRQRIADLRIRVNAMRWLGWRRVTDWVAGGTPGYESSIDKLVWSEYHVESSRLAMDILGTNGQILTGALGPSSYCDDIGTDSSWVASWTTSYLAALGSVTWGGTSDIQRNVIAERILGLPRE